MVMDESQFVLKCAEKKITSPDGICAEATKRIQEIDKILLEADKLRPERARMVNVLRTFGKEVPRPAKKPVVMVSDDTTEDALDPKVRELAVRVCLLISKEGPLKPRQIMDMLEILPGNETEVIVVAKWLSGSGVTVRLEDRALAPGPNWENRPGADTSVPTQKSS